MNQNVMQRYQTIKSLGQVTKPYGGSTRYEKFHPGIDIANKQGTPVPAFGQGGVVTNVDTGHRNGENNYGNQVAVKDDQGNTHYYSHLQGAYVKRGQRVHSGQPIGTMGATGSAYSPSGGDPTHLDYRVTNAYGKYRNPLQFMSNVK